MKQGYYLSAYVCIDKFQNIMNIKLRHDQSIALWQYKGNTISLVKYWELERISGIKQHAKAIFSKEKFIALLRYLLYEVNISFEEIIEIWGIKSIENISEYRTQFDSRFAFHSLSHLFTAIFYDNAFPLNSCILGMALDSRPDSQFEEDAYTRFYYTGCILNDGKFSLFPVESPARLWSYSYKKFGLREGTLMALSSAMETECYVLETLMNKWLQNKFYDESGRYLAQLLVDEIIEYVETIKESDAGTRCSKFDTRFSIQENKVSMIMKIISSISMKIVSRNIEYAAEKYNLNLPSTILALAGGFALNCPTNIALIEKYKFKSYQIPPCANDTGIAMGIGIAAFSKLLFSKQANIYIDTAFFGQVINNNIEQATSKYSHYIEKIEKVSIDYFVDALINGEILIWLNGNTEIGPRALGNRSLIATATSPTMKDNLNNIKKRQWWRPIAPLVIDEFGKLFFENYRTSLNMLLNLKIKSEKRFLIPAVIHYDNTARVQSVTNNSNHILYTLLKTYYDKTGIPILCNTSLNDAGEPIINTLEEAIEFALHKGLCTICINGNTVVKLHIEESLINLPFNLRNVDFFTHDTDFDLSSYLTHINPFELDLDELTFYFDNPNIYSKLSLDNPTHVKKLCKDTLDYKNKYKDGIKR